MSGRHRNEFPPDEDGYEAEPFGRPSEDRSDWFTNDTNTTPPADEGGSSDWFTPPSSSPADPPKPEGAPRPAPSGPPAPAPGGQSGMYGSSGFSGASDVGGYYPGAYQPYRPPSGSDRGHRGPAETPDSYFLEPGDTGGDTGGDPSGGPGGGPGGPGNVGDGPPSHRDGPAQRRAARRRRSLGALIGPLAGAIGLSILLGVGVYALADNRAGCGGGDPTTLDVAAAPDIAPVVSDIVARFNDQKHAAGDHCVKAIVKAVEPSSVATLLSGQGSAQGTAKPDVWIPDSTLWPTLVQSQLKGADAVQLSPTRLAQTPLVVAMSRPLVAKLKSQGGTSNPSWGTLLSAAGSFAGGAVAKSQAIPANLVRIQLLDPSLNASGMEALILARLLLTNDPHADTIFTAIVRSIRNQISPNIKALFGSFERDGAGRFPVLLTTEQSVWKYNRSHPAEPAVAIYPVEGTMTMEYPYALTTSDGDKLQAANVLEQAFNTPDAEAAVRALGFRTPDGKAGQSFGAASGVSPRRPRALPTPRSEDVQAAMSAWTKLTLGTRMLSMIDVSGSMGEKVPGTNVTRMQAIAQVAQGGLALYPDDTEIGQWIFSTNLDGNRDYKETIPIGLLSERIGSFTRRQQILAQLGRLRPVPNGDTGLNDSVLAAYRRVKEGYEPDKYNFVVVFTDGKNDDPSGGLSDRQLLAQLKREYDPNAPVQIIMIGFGGGVDRGAMERIAKATNGVAFVANKPQEIAKFFLEAITRRVCSPNCTGS